MLIYTPDKGCNYLVIVSQSVALLPSCNGTMEEEDHTCPFHQHRLMRHSSDMPMPAQRVGRCRPHLLWQVMHVARMCLLTCARAALLECCLIKPGLLRPVKAE